MKKLISLLLVLSIEFVIPNFTEAKTQNARISKYEYINMPFWQKYNDNILVNHIDNLYNNNLDLKIAAYKVEEGERIVKLAFSNELPNISFDGYAGRTLTSSDERFGDVLIPDYAQYRYLLPLTLSYEADIWGKNRLRTKSYKKQLEMLMEDERSLYIALSSNFAINYFNLIKTDKIIQIQDNLIDVQKKILDLVKQKYETGLATKNDILAEEKNLTLFEEERNNLSEKRDVLLNQISVYLGDRSFTEIERSNYESLNIPFDIPSEISFDKIENRPDIRKSIYAVEKAGFDVKSAKRDFLPSFTITGSLGYNAYSLRNLFGTHTGLAGVGVSPNLTIFDGGQKYNRMKLLKSRYNRMFEEYEKSLLTSAQEVNDALYKAKISKNNYDILEKRLELQNKDYQLVERKEEYGTADILNVLSMKEKSYITEQKNVSEKMNLIISTINLYKAAGGIDIYDNEDINL